MDLVWMIGLGVFWLVVLALLAVAFLGFGTNLYSGLVRSLRYDPDPYGQGDQGNPNAGEDAQRQGGPFGPGGGYMT